MAFYIFLWANAFNWQNLSLLDATSYFCFRFWVGSGELDSTYWWRSYI